MSSADEEKSFAEYKIEFSDQGKIRKTKAETIEDIIEILDEYADEYEEKGEEFPHYNTKIIEELIDGKKTKRASLLRELIKIEIVALPKKYERAVKQTKKKYVGKISESKAEPKQNSEAEPKQNSEAEPKQNSEAEPKQNSEAEPKQSSEAESDEDPGEMPNRKEARKTTRKTTTEPKAKRSSEATLSAEPKAKKEPKRSAEAKTKDKTVKKIGEANEVEIEKIIEVMTEFFEQNESVSCLDEKEFRYLKKIDWNIVYKLLKEPGDVQLGLLAYHLYKHRFINDIVVFSSDQIYKYENEEALYSKLEEKKYIVKFLHEGIERFFFQFSAVLEFLRNFENEQDKPKPSKLALYAEILKLNTKLIKKASNATFIKNSLDTFFPSITSEDKKKYLEEKNHLLPLPNKMVLDLRTGEIKSRNRKHFLKKQIKTEYKPEILNTKEFFKSRFYKFISQFCCEDENIIAEWQRALGYGLLANNPLKKFFIFVGGTNSGKSVLTSLFKRILGKEFCGKANGAVACKTINSSGARPEIVRIINLRIAFIQEIDSDDRLNIGTIKYLTGEEEIPTRGLFQNEEEKNILFTIYVATNKPINIPQECEADRDRLFQLKSYARFVDESMMEAKKRELESGTAEFVKIYPLITNVLDDFDDFDYQCGLAWLIQGTLDYYREKKLLILKPKQRPGKELDLINSSMLDVYKDYITRTVEFTNDEKQHIKWSELLNRVKAQPQLRDKNNDYIKLLDRTMEFYGSKRREKGPKQAFIFPGCTFKALTNDSDENDD